VSLRCQYRTIDIVTKALQFSTAGAFCEQAPAVWIHAGGKQFAICLTHARTITDYEQRFRLMPTKFEKFEAITAKPGAGCLRGGVRYKRHIRRDDGSCKACGSVRHAKASSS
jgi:hypothetical protein